MVAYLLLGLAQLVGVVVTALGWPGIFIQIIALGAFAWFVGTATFGVVPLAVLCGIGLLGEVIYLLIGGRIELPHRRRAGLLAIAGAIVGLLIGNFAVPLVGPMYGAVVGSLLAVSFTAVGRKEERVGCAKLARQALAMGIRTAAGVVVAVFILLTLIR
jgi:hypothetical protein